MPEKNENPITAESVTEDWSERLREAIINAKKGLRPWGDVDTVLTPAEVLLKRAQNDAVNHPSHYTSGGIECIDCIKAALGKNFIGFLIGNVIKYTYRYKDKNGVTDLEKASVYLKWAIEEMKKNG